MTTNICVQFACPSFVSTIYLLFVKKNTTQQNNKNNSCLQLVAARWQKVVVAVVVFFFFNRGAVASIYIYSMYFMYLQVYDICMSIYAYICTCTCTCSCMFANEYFLHILDIIQTCSMYSKKHSHGLRLQGALLVGSCAGKIGVQLIQGLLKVQLAGWVCPQQLDNGYGQTN